MPRWAPCAALLCAVNSIILIAGLRRTPPSSALLPLSGHKSLWARLVVVVPVVVVVVVVFGLVFFSLLFSFLQYKLIYTTAGG